MNIFKSIENPEYDSTEASIICKRLKEVKPPGNHIYIQYNTGLNRYPFKEKLHLGTLCCEEVKKGLIVPVSCAANESDEVEDDDDDADDADAAEVIFKQ